jgi:XTP/dITP diphosphohydrolase
MAEKIVLSTRNRDKLTEFEQALQSLPIQLICAADLPGAPEVEEDGATLQENALKKARALHRFSGLPTVADDTGLEVDALEGAPGVYSSRYAGPEATYADNVERVLFELQGLPSSLRTARFRCIIAYVDKERQETFEGVCEGVIIDEPRGSAGFGYDPIFLVPELGRTFAEMSLEEKNQISHRGIALRKFRHFLEKRWDTSGESSVGSAS